MGKAEADCSQINSRTSSIHQLLEINKSLTNIGKAPAKQIELQEVIDRGEIAGYFNDQEKVADYLGNKIQSAVQNNTPMGITASYYSYSLKNLQAMQSSDFSLNDVQLLERFLKNNLTQENFEISLALTCESLANGWENIVVDDHKLDQINEFACKQMSIQPVEIENSKSFPAAYLSELGVKLADHKFSKTESDLGAAYQKMVNDALCISQPYTFALTVEHLNKDKINFYAAWMQTPWLNALTRSDPDADYVDFIRDVENQLWQERKFFNQFMIAKIKECSQADPNYTFEAKLDLENDRFGVCSYILNDQAQGWVDQQAKTWLKDFLQMRAKNKIGLSEFQKIILKQSSRPD